MSDELKRKIFLFIFLVLLDQFSKFLSLHFKLFPISFNRGISFGLLPFEGWLPVDFFILILLGVILLRRASIPLVLIFTGGFSNFLDRIFWGGVVDFISLPFFPWKFNLADLGITIGIAILLYGYRVKLLPSASS